MKLEAQAVLRRADFLAPLRLSGVLLAGSFYPLTAQDAWGPLHLEVGLVALAPLTPVLARRPTDGVERAMHEARTQWSDPLPVKGELLSWRPIDEVRVGVADDDIRGLIAQMTTANDARAGSTPSTPPYHRAARELERLAGRVFEATSVAERVAEAGALRRQAGEERILDDG